MKEYKNGDIALILDSFSVLSCRGRLARITPAPRYYELGSAWHKENVYVSVPSLSVDVREGRVERIHTRLASPEEILAGKLMGQI